MSVPGSGAALITLALALQARGVRTSGDQAQLPVAFINVAVVPMDSERVLPGRTVLVQGDRITAVGPAGMPIPPDARIVDGTGRWLMPGLADMHVHFRRDDAELLLYVAHGVTTVRELSGEPDYLAWRREIAAGARTGPNLIISSPTFRAPVGKRAMATRLAQGGLVWMACFVILYFVGARTGIGRVRRWPVTACSATIAGAVAWAAVTRLLPFPDVVMSGAGVAKWWIGSPREAAALVRQAAATYDLVKLYEPMSRREFHSAVRAARAAGIRTVGHVPPAVALAEAVNDGLDELAHVYFLPNELLRTTDTLGAPRGPARDERYRQHLSELVTMISRSGVGITTTLMPLPEVRQRWSDSAAFASREDMRYRSRPLTPFQRITDPEAFLTELEFHIRWADEAVPALVRAGVPVAMGTDASPTSVVAGASALSELRQLHAAGLTRYQALRLATADAGAFDSAHAPWGTVTTGARADLVLLDADPLRDLAALERPLGVMVAGRWYERAALDSLKSEVVRRRRAP